MQYLEAGMRWLLELFADLTGSAGLGVILLTVVIRLLLWPLMTPQFRTTAKMRAIQPKVAALQEKYRDKPEELQRRLLQLYREEKVNPFSGCLLILVQMPFLWALYNMLRVYEFRQGFLWIDDLRAADPYFILPILSGVTMYAQSLLSGTGSSGDPTTKGMVAMMPIIFAGLTATLPAGVALYWVASTLFSIGQQWLINRTLGIPKPEDAKSAPTREEGGRHKRGRAAPSEGGDGGQVR
ncbi:MAG: membrane protein insertase YidC [Limnochordales bacterium]|nr:membrane protein insertase YidC [Limnochordales bacterium]